MTNYKQKFIKYKIKYKLLQEKNIGGMLKPTNIFPGHRERTRLPNIGINIPPVSPSQHRQAEHLEEQFFPIGPRPNTTTQSVVNEAPEVKLGHYKLPPLVGSEHRTQTYTSYIELMEQYDLNNPIYYIIIINILLNKLDLYIVDNINNHIIKKHKVTSRLMQRYSGQSQITTGYEDKWNTSMEKHPATSPKIVTQLKTDKEFTEQREKIARAIRQARHQRQIGGTKHLIVSIIKNIYNIYETNILNNHRNKKLLLTIIQEIENSDLEFTTQNLPNLQIIISKNILHENAYKLYKLWNNEDDIEKILGEILEKLQEYNKRKNFVSVGPYQY